VPGLIVVKIGPGRSERLHTPSERIAVAEFPHAVDAYRRIVRAYFEAEPATKRV